MEGHILEKQYDIGKGWLHRKNNVATTRLGKTDDFVGKVCVHTLYSVHSRGILEIMSITQQAADDIKKKGHREFEGQNG